MPQSRNRGKKYNTANQMSNQNKPIKSTGQSSVSVQHTHIKGEIFQSNYPPPEMLEKYAQIDSNFPNRLLSMAEDEGNHRRKMERRVANWSGVLDLLGILFALGAIAGILYTGYLFMKNDSPRLGTTIICSLVLTVAVIFITRGKRKK